MNKFKIPSDWWHHIFPLGMALIAAWVLILAPYWAWQWAQIPFLGVFIEANQVVSAIEGQEWPAKQAGVDSYVQITAIDDTPVNSARQMDAVLAELGSEQSVSIDFIDRQGNPGKAEIQARPFRLRDAFNWFLIPYIVGLAFLGIGLWAYRLGSQQSSARAFLTFTAALSIVTGAYFDMNTSQHFIWGWAFSIPVAAGALAHLALVFPRPMPFVRRQPLLRYLPWGLTVIFWIPMGIALWSPGNPWSYINTWLAAYGYSAVAIMLFLGSLLARTFRSISPMIRQQSRIIIFGSALAFGPILFLFLLPSATGQLVRFPVAIAFPALVVFPLTVAYAIVRYRMLDVDRFLGATLGYVLTGTVAVLIFYLLLALISLLIPSTLSPNNPAVIAIYLFLLVVGLNPLRSLMNRSIDRIFYRTRADYRRVLTRLSQELVVTPNQQHTYNLLEQEINATINPEGGALYLFDDDESIYRAKAQMGNIQPFPIPSESALVKFINRQGHSLWLPPGRSYPVELVAEQAVLEKLNCQVFVPLNYEGKLIGFFAMGSRRSGEPYTSDDLDFLDAVAGQSSLALENIRLFANLQDTLAQTLEMKNLLDDIFQSMSSGVITMDLQRKITLFNQAAERILGAKMDKVLGKSLPEALSSLGPQFSVMADDTIERGTITLGQELSPVLPQRGPTFLRMSCTPLRDAHLETKGATIVIDDLTETRQLEAERERIRQTFGRVVAPRVRDRLLEDPRALRLDGLRQELTVLFADIHQFTPFSERTDPENLFGILNSYLSLAAQAVLEEEGTLDKFMGDAVMAFWNAPDCQDDHTLRAARAALKMIQSLEARRTMVSEELKLSFSIGINVGEAMVGNVGTSDLFNYTAIGDMVNYAQRLESIAEPGQIILSEAVYQVISKHVIAKALPPVKVKGKSEAAVVYQLIKLKTTPSAGT